jgi:hypothetical protein
MFSLRGSLLGILRKAKDPVLMIPFFLRLPLPIAFFSGVLHSTFRRKTRKILGNPLLGARNDPQR